MAGCWEIECALDVRTLRAEKVAQRFDHEHEVRWGDICHADEVQAAVEGQDVIVHLAALTRPIIRRNILKMSP